MVLLALETQSRDKQSVRDKCSFILGRAGLGGEGRSGGGGGSVG